MHLAISLTLWIYRVLDSRFLSAELEPTMLSSKSIPLLTDIELKIILKVLGFWGLSGPSASCPFCGVHNWVTKPFTDPTLLIRSSIIKQYPGTFSCNTQNPLSYRTSHFSIDSSDRTKLTVASHPFLHAKSAKPDLMPNIRIYYFSGGAIRFATVDW